MTQKKLTKNTPPNNSALIKNLKTFLQTTLTRYNLYTTQHQKHFQKETKILLIIVMNIILCDGILHAFKRVSATNNISKKIKIFFFHNKTCLKK